MATRNLYLVRHGHLAFPDGIRRCIGRTEYPLSEQGARQAEALRGFFADRPIERVFHSPLGRCRRTARIIGNGRVPLQEEPGLVELDMGEWEDVPLCEIDKELETEPVRGEGRQAGLARIRAAIEGVLARTSGDLVCVAHAGVNCCLLADIGGTPLATSRGLRQPYGCYSRIVVEDGGRMEIAELGRLPGGAVEG